MAKSSEKPPPPATHAFSSPTTDLVTKSVPPTAVMYGDAAGKSGLNRLRKKARVRQRKEEPRQAGRDSLLPEAAALAPADALVARREEDGEAAHARLHESGVRRLHVLGRHLLLLVVAVRDRVDLTQKTRCAQRETRTLVAVRETEWTRGGFSSDEICLAQARSEYCELYTTVSGT